MGTRPEHCTALPGQECWECYQTLGGRVSERWVELGRGLVAIRHEELSRAKGPELHERLEALERAVRLLRGLVSLQWRQMVREPFGFAGPKAQASKPAIVDKLSFEDLDL